MTRYRRRLVAGVVVMVIAGSAGALAAALGGAPGSDHPGFTPIQFSGDRSGAVATSVTSGTLDGALTELAGRVEAPNIVSTAIKVVAPTEGRAGGVTAFLTVKEPSPGPAAIQDVWKAELVAGALRDVAAAKGLSPLDNFEIDAQLPDGTTVPSTVASA